MSNCASKHYRHNYEISENSKRFEKFEGIWIKFSNKRLFKSQYYNSGTIKFCINYNYI